VAHHDAIGVLVLDEKGAVKVEKVGKRSVGKGVGIGLVLALFTPIGLAVGVTGGGLLGALHHKGLGLDEADRERIGSELAGGKAAVGVLAPVSEADFVASKLTELGGAIRLMRSPTKLSRKPTRPSRQPGPRANWPSGPSATEKEYLAESRRVSVPAPCQRTPCQKKHIEDPRRSLMGSDQPNL
jgi:uncharacterized membrane protein